MERKEVVLDASVAIKWFTQEEYHDKAIKIREQFIKGEIDILVPDIILYELANALKFNPKFNSNDVEEALRSIFNMDITIILPIQVILQKAVQISFLKNITIYDAMYVSLASNLSCSMVTADKKLYNKIKDLGFISLLEEFNI